MLTCDLVPVASVEEALGRVEGIDLSPICRKLRVSDPASWPKEQIDEAERLYRRFLALNLLHPGEDRCPTSWLDEFWHQHIVDTRKYAADCELLFGKLLHHDPYFGINGDRRPGQPPACLRMDAATVAGGVRRAALRRGGAVQFHGLPLNSGMSRNLAKAEQDFLERGYAFVAAQGGIPLLPRALAAYDLLIDRAEALGLEGKVKIRKSDHALLEGRGWSWGCDHIYQPDLREQALLDLASLPPFPEIIQHILGPRVYVLRRARALVPRDNRLCPALAPGYAAEPVGTA